MVGPVKEWGSWADLLARLACWGVRELRDHYGATVSNLNGDHLVIRDHRGHVKRTSAKPHRKARDHEGA